VARRDRTLDNGAGLMVMMEAVRPKAIGIKATGEQYASPCGVVKKKV